MNQTDQPLPAAIEAEEALLGAALMSPQALEIAVLHLESADFYKPAHRAIHGALKSLWESGARRTDHVIVVDELRTMGDLEAVGGDSVLLTLASNSPSFSNADEYTRIIQDKSLSRRLVKAGQHIMNLGLDQDAAEVGKALARTKAIVAELELPIGAIEPSINVAQFLEQETEVNWLVKDLIERGDRIILTGSEGSGKSTVIRQIAFQLACGIHPFNSTFITPLKVLIIDVENSVPQIQRKLQQLKVAARDNYLPENLFIEVRNEGLDLTNRHDSRWLLERVESVRPDLVTIGPIYKLHNQDPTEELPARAVAAMLDRIRVRYGCALMIEAHSPHGTPSSRPLRPFGASLWMRWPEFGYGIRGLKSDPSKFKFESWRGPRDVRAWPEMLQRGGAWPWTAVPSQTRLL